MNIDEYENFCENSGCGSFMQSTYWANVKENWSAECIAVYNDSEDIVGTILILIKKIPLLNTAMLYAPRGPVCDMHNMEILEEIFEQVKQIAKKHHAYTIKLDPLIDENDDIAIENLKQLGFAYHPEKVGYDNIQCRENYIIDIGGRSADEIFEGFKQKCRYNIRLAIKKGVSCGFYGEEKLDDFENLMKETAERDGFEMRTKEYFRRILRSFNGKAKLCMCNYYGIPLSGALFIDYAGTVSYVYGCSSGKMRNYMPNYLMQWTMIKYAAENKRDRYDFCGIPYWYDETHKNYGVYKFKQEFNGYVKTWAGEFDYSFRRGLNRCANLIMKLRKHL